MGWITEGPSQPHQGQPGWKTEYEPPKDRGQTPDRPINLSGMSRADEQAAVAKLPRGDGKKGGAYYVGDDGLLHQNVNGPGGNPAIATPKGAFLAPNGDIHAPDPYKKGSFPRLDFSPANGWYMKSHDGQYVNPEGQIKRGVGPEAQQARGQVSGGLANFNRGMGLGDELQGGLTGAAGVVEGLLGDPHHPIRNLGDVGATFADGMRQQRETEDAFNQQRPAAANLLRGSGAAATLLAPGPKGIMAGSRAGNAARGAVTAATYGAGYALADRGTAGERIAAAENPKGIAVNAALGGVLGGVAPGAPKPPKTFNTGTDAGLLQSEGAVMTPGQRMGGRVNDIEQKLTSAPIIGGAISDARRAAFGSWNRVEANRALANIGESVPHGMEPGPEMTAFVRDRLRAAYNDAHDMVPQVVPDAAFQTGMAGALREAPLLPRDRMNVLQTFLQDRVRDQLQKGPLTGRFVKEMVEDLGREQRAYAASAGSSPHDGRIATILGNVKAELKGLVARQSPAAADLLARTDRGYAAYKRIEKAASSVANADGVYTPAQMFNAVKAADTSASGFATGQSHGYDMAGAAKRTLGNTIPDSGTAGRTATGAALAGTGYALAELAHGNAVPAAVGSGLAAASGLGAAYYNNIARAARLGAPPVASTPSPQLQEFLTRVVRARLAQQEGGALAPIGSQYQSLLQQPGAFR